MIDEDRSVRSDFDISSMEVTVDMFSVWLRRYGPFKDALCKASVLVLPIEGRPVTWFGRGLNRAGATRQLEVNLSRSSSSGHILPSNLFVLRYSSDPNFQFVVTTKPVRTVEHYTIKNSPLGYYLSSNSSSSADSTPQGTCPTLLECIQTHIFDKLFAKILRDSVCLSRESFSQWDDIFSAAALELPEDHYVDVGALNRAVEAAQSVDWESDAGAGSMNYASMFEKQSSTEEDGSDIKEEVLTEIDSQDVAESQSSHSHLTPRSQDKTVIGRYMVFQGLELLQETNSLQANDANTIRDILAKIAL